MKKFLLATAAISLLAVSAEAKMFSIHMNQGTLDETRSFKSVKDVFDHYKSGSLDKIFNTYDDTKASNSVLDFRGIDMNFVFNDAGDLNYTVPEIGIDENFSGGSQEASFRMFLDYLKGNKNGILKRILRYGVQKTPYDMVAGNPNSLMSNMTDASFERAGGGILGSFASYFSPDASTHHFKYKGDNKKAEVVTLPMGKTFKFANGSALMFDLPFSYTDMEGSRIYSAQFGMSYMFPVMMKEHFEWRLTPGVRAGAVISSDMLAGGALYNGTITSNIKVPVGNMTYSMTNMIGYIRDQSVKIGGYEVAYDMKNTVFKNGVAADYDINEKWRLGGSYSYTFYEGDDLYIKDYSDINVVLSRELKKGSLFSRVALVGNYSFGSKDYHAYRIGISFMF